MDKGLKKCSTSTDVEPVPKVTDPLQKAKRESDNLGIKEKRKKQKKDKEKSDKKEVKKLRKSFKELTGIMEELKEIIQSKADLPVMISFRQKEEEKKDPVEPINECNFGNKDHLINMDRSLFVRGFDTCLPRQEIKSALWKHFESCGKVKRVYVPIECDTGSSLGFAFIEMEQGCTMGTILHGSDLEERELDVEYAKFRDESFGFYNFIGCDRCSTNMPWLNDRDTCRRYASYPFPRRNWRTVGTPYSKIGRFTANIARVFN